MDRVTAHYPVIKTTSSQALLEWKCKTSQHAGGNDLSYLKIFSHGSLFVVNLNKLLCYGSFNYNWEGNIPTALSIYNIIFKIILFLYFY